MQISLLHPEDESLWEQLVLDSPLGMFYHSIKWLHLLSDFTGAVPLHLVAKQDGRLVGILPVFLRKGKWGNVLNSSPFYGSHGGIIVHPDGSESEVKKQLLDAFKEIAISHGCITSTIISSPFDTACESYEQYLQPQQIDQRIGQIVSFPSSDDHPEGALMQSFESRGRNSVRKAMKSGVKVFCSSDQKDFQELYSMHSNNMQELGGNAKPLMFFKQLQEAFVPEKEWQIWLAEFEGNIVAALLVLYYKNMVEYYTPVIKREYRAIQPLSLIMFKAMIDAMEHGCRYWNFGGTWLSQEGVYRFKRQWNAEDYPYYYYVNIYDNIETLTNVSKEELLQKYQWFYVFPFEKTLRSGQP
jgi:hypothetical protein